MSGALDPEAAVIDATLLPDLLVLHASAHKALKAQQRGTLRTKTVHTELVFGLSGSKHVSGCAAIGPHSCLSSVAWLAPPSAAHLSCASYVRVQIGEALSRFGIRDESRHLVIARLNATPAELERLRAAVAGREAPVEELPALADVAAVRRQYKILDEELSVGSVVDAIVSRIAAYTSA